MLDETSGRFVRSGWPPEWSALQENLTDKMNGGSPPFRDERGLLVVFPVFGGAADSDREHWLVAELDLNYVRKVWLPDLAARYLDSGGQSVDEFIIQTTARTPMTIYSSQSSQSMAGASVVSVPFNFLGRTLDMSREPPTLGARWVLETWQPPGALETLVSASRLRNLAVAVAINLIMLATGIVLVRHTRQSREMAEQQIKFVASVSHELRTPLTVIRGAAHNIQRGVVTAPGQVEKYSSLIIENCEQLTEMIEQVLAFAGAQKNRSGAARQSLLLTDVLNDAIAATAHDVDAAHCALDVRLPSNLPAIIGDGAALRRAFQNLITNAAKHGGRGGWIGITAVANGKPSQPMVEIQVADRGPGIPQKELSEIFKPFFRGEHAAQVRGNGLGLNLVREIVEAHQGAISVRSEIGKGATFTVRLPVTGTNLEK
jgi:signal transduction histidine kinase